MAFGCSLSSSRHFTAAAAFQPVLVGSMLKGNTPCDATWHACRFGRPLQSSECPGDDESRNTSPSCHAQKPDVMCMRWRPCCQVDTAGLLRAEKTRARTVAREAGREDVDTQDSQARQQDEGSGEELEEHAGEAQGEGDSDSSAKPLEMLPMGAVGHLGRADRMGIIRKTVPNERRMAVLQRLFQLAQGKSLVAFSPSRTACWAVVVGSQDG